VVFTDEELAPSEDYLDRSIYAAVAKQRYKSVGRRDKSDASRVMFLHGRSYPGVERDIEATLDVMSVIEDLWNHRSAPAGSWVECVLDRPQYDDVAATQVERAVYRLSLLGIVDDYTIDYPISKIHARTNVVSTDEAEQHLERFIERYDTEQRAEAARKQAQCLAKTGRRFESLIQVLCSFIYEVIERSRRYALQNVVRAMRAAGNDGEKLRAEIALHLSTNVFSGQLSNIVAKLEPEGWWKVLDQIHNAPLARQLLGPSRRLLESNPTDPGLHFMAAFGSLQSTAFDIREVSEHLVAGLGSLLDNYMWTTDRAMEIAHELVRRMREVSPERFEQVIASIVLERRNELFARAAYLYIQNRDLRRACAVPWIASMTRAARTFRDDYGRNDLMTMQRTELDDYHVEMQRLINEIGQYGAALGSLRSAAESLEGIHQIGTAAAVSLHAVSKDVDQSLETLRSLKLDELYAATRERYEAHQASLDVLEIQIKDAVREQQRLGLEMLQHTTASQRELDRYARQVKEAATASAERQSALDAKLDTLMSHITTIGTQLQASERQLAMLRTLLLVTIILVAVVGGIAFVR
jgi:hypothetical protein